MAVSTSPSSVGEVSSERGTVVLASTRPAAFAFTGRSSASSRPRRMQAMLKRLLDVIVALALLAVALPLCILVAVAVRVDSRGPILFGQTRIGRDLRPFRLWKFRSMY